MIPMFPRRACLPAILVAALGLVAGCSKPEAKMCETGIYCPAGSECAARQPICIWNKCGNLVVDAGEECDDGNNLDKDGCSADCKSDESCGNEHTDDLVGESCDDGNHVDGDGCSADCRRESCGNTDVDKGEDCDGGPGEKLNEAKETLVCTAHCLWSSCGDEYTNETAGEDCDNGPGARANETVESEHCNTNCRASVCGDRVTNKTAGEECDDGTANGLNARCLPETCQENKCGDGHQYIGREACDDGPENAPEGTNFTGACLPGCIKAVCGDGHQQAGVEDCDEGPSSARDDNACPYGVRSCQVCNKCKLVTETHRLTGYCGDGTSQAGHEACDEGTDRSTPKYNGSTTCDYNVKTCTHCNTLCTAQDVDATGPYCGDHIKQPNEFCDDPNGNNGLTYCPGGTSCSPICNSNCTGFSTMQYCGDGTTQAGHEACDEGTNRSTPKYNGSTTCDYNVASCMHCNTACTAADVVGTGPRCGDGTRQQSNEACDDGDGVNGTKYRSDGQFWWGVCNANCTGSDTDGVMWCGDGSRNGPEECEDSRSVTCNTCGKPGTQFGCRNTLFDQANGIRFGPARGTVTIRSTSTSGSSSLSGVRVRINDGAGGDKTFVFVTALPDNPSGLEVLFVSGSAPSDVAVTLAGVINATTGLAITAKANGAAVDLTNDHSGVSGNQDIGVTPDQASAIRVTKNSNNSPAMVGGVGCSEGWSCARSEDCLSGVCTSNRCAASAGGN